MGVRLPSARGDGAGEVIGKVPQADHRLAAPRVTGELGEAGVQPVRRCAADSAKTAAATSSATRMASPRIRWAAIVAATKTTVPDAPTTRVRSPSGRRPAARARSSPSRWSSAVRASP